MPLFNLPTIKVPVGTRYAIAIFLATFFFFFTQPESQTDTGSEETSK